MTSRAEIRRAIMTAFDDGELDAFLSDHIPEVRARFSAGMVRDQRVTLLLDFSEKDQFERLAAALADPNERRDLAGVLRIVESYREAQIQSEVQSAPGGRTVRGVDAAMDSTETQAAIARIVTPEFDPVALRPAALDMNYLACSGRDQTTTVASI